MPKNEDFSADKWCNVMYLTTKCNLECEYCYEFKDRKSLSEHKSISMANIEKYMDELCLNSSENKQKIIIIQGGEPFREFELLKYVFDYSRENYSNHELFFGILTNGLFFSTTKNLNRYLEEIVELLPEKHALSADISYDGTGHSRRVFPSGKSSKKEVEQGILNYKRFFPKHLRIRYTIQRDNKDPETLLNDWVSIIEKYHPERIVTSNFLEEAPMLLVYKYIAKNLYKRYGTPICDFTCGWCKQCDKGLFQVDNTEWTRRNYINPDGKKILITGDAGKFNHFTT